MRHGRDRSVPFNEAPHFLRAPVTLQLRPKKVAYSSYVAPSPYLPNAADGSMVYYGHLKMNGLSHSTT